MIEACVSDVTVASVNKSTLDQVLADEPKVEALPVAQISPEAHEHRLAVLEDEFIAQVQRQEAQRAATDQLSSKHDELKALILASFADLKAHISRQQLPSGSWAFPPAVAPALRTTAAPTTAAPTTTPPTTAAQLTADQQARALANKQAALVRRQQIGGAPAHLPHAAPASHLVDALVSAPALFTTPMQSQTPRPTPLLFAGFQQPPPSGVSVGCTTCGGAPSSLSHADHARAQASREAALRRREECERKLPKLTAPGGKAAEALGVLLSVSSAAPACLGRSNPETVRSFKAPRRISI